jgi:small-conductance mechanosensitive channel
MQFCSQTPVYCSENAEQQHEIAGSASADLSVTLKELTNLDHEKFVISKDRLQKTSRRISVNIGTLEKRLAPYLGAWVSWQIASGISSLKVIAFLLLILLVAAIDWLCRRLIRRRMHAEEKDSVKIVHLREVAESRHSNFNAFLFALKKPLSLFIWIYGIYTGLSLLFGDAGQLAESDWFLNVAGQLTDIGGFFVAFWLLFRSIALIDIRLTLWADGTPSRWDTLLVPFIGKCLRFVLPLIAIILAMPMFNLSESMKIIVQNITSIAIIAAVAWILVQLVLTIEKGIVAHFKAESAGSMKARAIFTQVYVLKKIILLVVGIFSLGSMLMVFESVRQLGTSILASAGVVGIIVGLSAQKTIALLLAGLQIALTQPIRIEDVVIVENEWGWIEEITLTYVVVRIWDLRRLVVPINYFIEKPFQNWTRTSADILGAISIFVDYTVPVEEIRKAAKEIVSASALWDKKVCGVQITNTTDRAMELRVLISAASSGQAWDLRCEVREKLVAFIQKNYPDCLPKIRTDSPEVAV